MPQKKLSLNEKRRLYLLLMERQNRGLEIPKLKDYSAVSSDWGVDENGYFIRDDGMHYEPSQQQEAFVNSTAKFAAYYGSRGCIGASTRIGGVPVGDIKEPHPVSSVYGSFIADTPFLKGRDSLYKVTTQSGSVVWVTQKHRFLSPFGWSPLSSFHVGDLILSDGTYHAMPGKGKLLGSLDCYSSDFRLGGELHNLAVMASLNILQQLHKTVYENSASVPPLIFHLSTVDFLSRMLLQFFVQFHFLQVSEQLLFQSVRIFYRFLLSHFQKNMPVSHLLLEYQRFLDAHISRNDESLTVLKFQRIFHNYENQEYGLFQLDVSQDCVNRGLLSTTGVYSKVLPEITASLDSAFVYGKEYQEKVKHDKSLLSIGLASDLFYSHFDRNENKIPLLSYNHISDLLVGGEGFLGYSLLQYCRQQMGQCASVLQLPSQESLVLFFELLRNDLCISFSPPSIICSNYNPVFDKIQDITYEKESEFYDLTVPFSSNYSAEGLFHHNSGKTASGIQKALRKVMDGNSGAIMNADLENLKVSTWPELRRWLPWNMVVPRQRYRQSPAWDATRPFTLVFVNGAHINIKGLKDPGSGRGVNANWFWYDEGGRDKTGMGWKLTLPGIRIGKNPQSWTTYSPTNMAHWSYEFFILQKIPDELKTYISSLPAGFKLIETFHGTREDNKAHLSEGFYEFLSMAYPSGWLRLNELEGEYANEGGALGTREWFNERMLSEAPDWAYKKVRYWDLAASEKKVGTDPDETVGTLLSTDEPKEKFCIENQVGGFWLWDKIKENIRTIARMDGTGVAVWIEQEPASGGKNQVAELANFLKDEGFVVKGHNPKDDGDRVLAANTWYAEAAAGKFWMVKGLWNEKLFMQIDTFPDAPHDDHITSITGARHVIAPIRKWKKAIFHAIGMPDKKALEKV